MPRGSLRNSTGGPGRSTSGTRHGGHQRASAPEPRRGEQRAFQARQSAHAARPDLTEFRLLWDTLASSFTGRSKLILDPRAGGRRQVWLADPERLGLGRVLTQEPANILSQEPED